MNHPTATTASELVLDRPRPSVAVIGSGYVGLTTAACLAHLGQAVVGIDIDSSKIDELNQGRVPILEQRLDELVDQGLASGRLRFSSLYTDVADAAIVILCLPTPVLAGGGLDLSSLEQAATALRPVLADGAVVVTKSTVPVGTHRRLANWLQRPDVAVASNPEFLREGTAVHDFLHPDRIVIGAADPAAAQAVAGIYAGIDRPMMLTDPLSAELVKYAANTFLATKLSFINEISRLCDRLGADIDSVRAGLGSDHRIGESFLRPGPGWGGSCFPKDTQALVHLARTAAQDLPVTKAAHDSNLVHLAHITGEIVRWCDRDLLGARVAFWGATFKAGTDDLRDSPATEIAGRIRDMGADVVMYDPAASADRIGLPTTADLYSACHDADLLVVMTEWPEFAEADLDKVAALMRGTGVYDTRYVIAPALAAAAGLRLGQPGKHLQ